MTSWDRLHYSEHLTHEKIYWKQQQIIKNAEYLIASQPDIMDNHVLFLPTSFSAVPVSLFMKLYRNGIKDEQGFNILQSVLFYATGLSKWPCLCLILDLIRIQPEGPQHGSTRVHFNIQEIHERICKWGQVIIWKYEMELTLGGKTSPTDTTQNNLKSEIYRHLWVW